MIVVVGATGQIGRELVALLQAGDVAVRAFVRDPARARQFLGDAVELTVGNLAEPSTLRPALKGAEGLFLVSSNQSLELGVLREAARAGVRIVKSSAIGFGSEPPARHARVEEELEASGVPFTILRPNAFMQTLRDYLPRLLDVTGTFMLPAGAGRTAWVDVRDIAAVAAVALTERGHDSAVHLISGPESVTMDEVAAIVGAGIGRSLDYRSGPPAEVYAALAERVGPEFADFLTAHYQSVARGGFAEVHDTVRRLTGRSARSLAELVSEAPERWQPDPGRAIAT